VISGRDCVSALCRDPRFPAGPKDE
jgi:hypothetical protein